MKFRKLPERPTPTSPGVGRSRGRPDWLKEWLASRGQYVRLTCGHTEDLRYGALLILATFSPRRGKDVMCERCNQWVAVDHPITFQEYFGLPAVETPKTPLF